MSSHHFVKEDQEPALLIIDPNAIPFEKVQELLEWSPLVMVSRSALEKVLEWGIKIDVLLNSGNKDFLAQIIIDQAPLQVITTSSAENEFDAACKFLMDRKQTNLNVIASQAQKYFTIATSLLNKVNTVLFDSNGRWYYVGNGSYSKWLSAKTTTQIFINGNFEKSIVTNTGVFKIERSSAFWVGEEY